MTTRREIEKAIINLVNEHQMPFRWQASEFLMLHRANPMDILPNFYQGSWRKQSSIYLEERYFDRWLALINDKRTKFLIGIDGLYVWNGFLMEYGCLSNRSFKEYDVKLLNMKSQKIEFYTNLDRQCYNTIHKVLGW